VIGTAPSTAPHPVGSSPSRRLIGTAELARRWQVSRYTIHRMCVDGHIPGAWQLPTGTWRIPLTAVLAIEDKAKKRESMRVIRRPPGGR
jgi:predicted site-specific integrase-resolvase